VKPAPPPAGPAPRRWARRTLESTAEAVAAESDGRAVDWAIILDPHAAEPAARARLHVTVATRHGSRQVAATLSGNLLPGPDPRPECDAPSQAAIRRHSFEHLFWRCHSADPEPLIEYLRCCGVLVLDDPPRAG